MNSFFQLLFLLLQTAVIFNSASVIKFQSFFNGVSNVDNQLLGMPDTSDTEADTATISWPKLPSDFRLNPLYGAILVESGVLMNIYMYGNEDDPLSRWVRSLVSIHPENSLDINDFKPLVNSVASIKMEDFVKFSRIIISNFYEIRTEEYYDEALRTKFKNIKQMEEWINKLHSKSCYKKRVSAFCKGIISVFEREKGSEGFFSDIQHNPTKLYPENTVAHILFSIIYLKANDTYKFDFNNYQVPVERSYDDVLDDSIKLIPLLNAGFPPRRQSISITLEGLDVSNSFKNCAENSIGGMVDIIRSFRPEKDFDLNRGAFSQMGSALTDLFSAKTVDENTWSLIIQNQPFVLYRHLYSKRSFSDVTMQAKNGITYFLFIKGIQLESPQLEDCQTESKHFVFKCIKHPNKTHYIVLIPIIHEGGFLLGEVEPCFYSVNALLRILYQRDFSPNTNFSESFAKQQLTAFLHEQFQFKLLENNTIDIGRDCSFELFIDVFKHTEIRNSKCKQSSPFLADYFKDKKFNESLEESILLLFNKNFFDIFTPDNREANCFAWFTPILREDNLAERLVIFDEKNCEKSPLSYKSLLRATIPVESILQKILNNKHLIKNTDFVSEFDAVFLNITDDRFIPVISSVEYSNFKDYVNVSGKKRSRKPLKEQISHRGLVIDPRLYNYKNINQYWISKSLFILSFIQRNESTFKALMSHPTFSVSNSTLEYFLKCTSCLQQMSLELRKTFFNGLSQLKNNRLLSILKSIHKSTSQVFPLKVDDFLNENNFLEIIQLRHNFYLQLFIDKSFINSVFSGEDCLLFKLLHRGASLIKLKNVVNSEIEQKFSACKSLKAEPYTNPLIENDLVTFEFSEFEKHLFPNVPSTPLKSINENNFNLVFFSNVKLSEPKVIAKDILHGNLGPAIYKNALYLATESFHYRLKELFSAYLMGTFPFSHVLFTRIIDPSEHFELFMDRLVACTPQQIALLNENIAGFSLDLPSALNTLLDKIDSGSLTPDKFQIITLFRHQSNSDDLFASDEENSNIVPEDILERMTHNREFFCHALRLKEYFSSHVQKFIDIIPQEELLSLNFACLHERSTEKYIKHSLYFFILNYFPEHLPHLEQRIGDSSQIATFINQFKTKSLADCEIFSKRYEKERLHELSLIQLSLGSPEHVVFFLNVIGQAHVPAKYFVKLNVFPEFNLSEKEGTALNALSFLMKLNDNLFINVWKDINLTDPAREIMMEALKGNQLPYTKKVLSNLFTHMSTSQVTRMASIFGGTVEDQELFQDYLIGGKLDLKRNDHKELLKYMQSLGYDFSRMKF